MLGGAKAPGVAKALTGDLTEPPAKGTFDPKRWNSHVVFVRNADGGWSYGGRQALTF